MFDASASSRVNHWAAAPLPEPSRAELAGVLAGAGFEVREEEPYLGFGHRVDQAIVRDLIVARKTA